MIAQEIDAQAVPPSVFGVIDFAHCCSMSMARFISKPSLLESPNVAVSETNLVTNSQSLDIASKHSKTEATTRTVHAEFSDGTAEH